IADITFARAQLVAVSNLAQSRMAAQEKVVERLKNTVKAGTDPQATLITEGFNLEQIRIQAKKDVHEADTAVRVAVRNEAAAARQLQQAGLDPDPLRSVTSDIDI